MMRAPSCAMLRSEAAPAAADSEPAVIEVSWPMVRCAGRSMIDFHQHIGHMGRSLEQTLAHQEAHGVEKSVILPIDSTATPPEFWPSDIAFAAAREEPDRLGAFVHADPQQKDAPDTNKRGCDDGERDVG